MFSVIETARTGIENVLKSVFTYFFDQFTGNPDFAWVLASWMFIAFLIIVLFGAARTAYRYLEGIRPVQSEIRRALGKYGTNVNLARENFAKGFERLDARLSKKRRFLGEFSQAWLEFKETLFDESEQRDGTIQVKNNGVRPHPFYKSAVKPPSFLGLFSNLFVGIGLLFTFIGIVAVLRQAGADLQSASSSSGADTGAALTKLISAASTKFITSIFGVGCSILLKLTERGLAWIHIHGLEVICRDIETGLRYQSEQSLSDQMLAENRQQTAALKNMSQTIATQIGEKFQTALEPLAANITSLKEAVDKSAAEQAQTIREAAGGAVSEATGAELRALSDSLGSFGTVMGGLQDKLEQSGNTMASQIAGSAKQIETMLTGLPEALARAGKNSAEGFEDVNRRAREDMAKILSDAAEQIRLSTTQSGQDIAALIGELKGFVTGLPEKLKTTADHQAKLLEAASQSASDAFSKTVSSAGSDIAALPEKLLMATSAAAEELKAASAATRETLTQAHAKFEAAAGAVAKLGPTITQWRDGADASVKEMKELLGTAQAQHRAAAELSTTLKTASDSTTTKLTSIAEGINSAAGATGDALEAAKTLHASITQTQEAIQNSWANYEERFKGVDADLAKAADALSQSAEGFAEKLSTQIRSMDEALSQNVQGLKGATDHLAEMLEESRAAQQQGSRAAE